MHRYVLAIAAVLLAACGSKPEELEEFRHQSFYETVQQAAEGYTLVDGDWKEDFGDSSFYGLGFYARAGVSTGNQGFLDKADEAYARCHQIVQNADLLNDDVNEIIMCGLGLIEYMDAMNDRSAVGDLDIIIDSLGVLVESVGWYLETDLVETYAIDTYGPTAVSALVGLLSLQYAHVLGGDQADYRVGWAQTMYDHIEQVAWNGTYYDFSTQRPGLFQYPNVSMIIFNARLYQLTGEGRYKNRALEVYDGIQPLRVNDDLPGTVRYKSPYSAEVMGAQTDDYTTLSSSNYTMFALMLLYEITGRVSYIAQVHSILDFLESFMYGDWCLSDWHLQPCDPVCDQGQVCVDGTCMADSCHQGVLHHWMDGRLALPQDPEMFCSGCNQQLLYLMWYRQEMIE